MNSRSMSKNLDYNIDSVDERKNRVNEIIESNDGELTTYFDDYYNPALSQNSRLSENDPICKQLEKMADYLLYADNKEKQKENYGEKLDIINNSDDKNNKKKESLTGDISVIEKEDKKVHQHKLYKKVKVNNDDRKQYKELGETGEVIKQLKKMIETGVDTNGTPISEDSLKKIKWYLIEIRKDEVAMKEILKGYIRFKRLSPEGVDNDYSMFNFTDKKHVRVLFENYSQLKQGSFDDTHGDLKTIIEVFEDIVDSIEFEPYIYDIFIMKVDGLSRKTIVSGINKKHGIVISESRVSQITKNVIPDLIVENYKKNYEEWLYTFVKKGIYKTCSKCGETKLATTKHFSPHKKGKHGLHSQCRTCRKKQV